MLQQGPTPQESIKRQTLSARGLSDKEFTKHCRGFDGQIKVTSKYCTGFFFDIFEKTQLFKNRKDFSGQNSLMLDLVLFEQISCKTQPYFKYLTPNLQISPVLKKNVKGSGEKT